VKKSHPHLAFCFLTPAKGVSLPLGK
jgi:hypothetical protein